MSTLGSLARRADGAFLGQLALKSYAGRVLLQPVGTKPSAAAPDFRLWGVGDQGGRFEMGAAWIRTRADGQGTYVSLKIDYPELPGPVYATLGVMAGQDDPDLHAVIWNRPSETRSGGADPFAGMASRPAAEEEGAVVDPFDGLADGAASAAAPAATSRRRRTAETPEDAAAVE
jgi:uncharacterized protein (DUF736 family)